MWWTAVGSASDMSAVVVAVCIATRDRPEGLQRLLDGLECSIFPDLATPDVRVVIVDNSPVVSADSVIASRSLRWPTQILHEPVPGIPAARNRGLREVVARVDYIAFIDDDEFPDELWLAELLRTAATTGAGVVTGPVLPDFRSPPPRWITAGRFFERPRHPTGTILTTARTGNALVASHALRKLDRWFDERLALTGGSDTELFQRLHRQGHAIEWCDEAVVRESVPRSRLRPTWIFRRGFRYGVNRVQRLRFERAPSWRWLWLAVAVAGELVVSGLHLLAAAFRGKSSLVRAGDRFSRALGTLFGLAGGSYEEYRRVHGVR